jgi:hypothetical protein
MRRQKLTVIAGLLNNRLAQSASAAACIEPRLVNITSAQSVSEGG